MRIKVVAQPTQHSLDGIDLDRFHVGVEYEVGNTTGSFFLAQGWAVPAPDEGHSSASPNDTEPTVPSIPRRPALFPARYQQRAVAAEHATRRPRSRRERPRR
jgi:hypothetical protein